MPYPLGLVLALQVALAAGAHPDAHDLVEEVTIEAPAVYAGWRQFQVLDVQGRPVPALDAGAVHVINHCATGAPVEITPIHAQRSDKPVVLALIVDCSGSMRARTMVHAFLLRLVSQLDGADRLRIFTFGRRTQANEWATIGTYRRALLLERLRGLVRAPDRPRCLAALPPGVSEAGGTPSDDALEAWANSCSPGELEREMETAWRGYFATTLVAGGASAPSDAVLSAMVSLVTPDADGFVPAYDGQSSLVLVSDFDLLGIPSDVATQVQAVREAFLVQQLNVTIGSLPSGVPGGGMTFRLTSDSAGSTASLVARYARSLNEVTFDIEGARATRAGCVSVAYGDGRSGLRVVQPSLLVPPRDVLMAALSSGPTTDPQAVLGRLVGRSRGGLEVLGRVVRPSSR